MRFRPRRLALAGLITSLLWAAPALPAQAAGDAAWWSRLDQLLGARAYPAAEAELIQALHDQTFQSAWRDRASYLLGFTKRRSGKAAEALSDFQAVSKESRWYLSALSEMAAIRRNNGEFQAAIALYQRLNELSSESERPAVVAALADLYFLTSQYDKAQAGYHQLAEAAGPYRERALFAWGWALVRSHQEEAAINVWKEGLEYFPTSRYGQAVRLALGNLLLARGDHLTASTFYNEAARQGQDIALMARAELLAGEAYADSKDYSVALSHYRAVPTDSPLREPAGYGEAWCLWQLGRFEEARQAFKDWAYAWPQSSYNAPVSFALGMIERQLGHADAARAAWEKVDTLAPKSPWAEDALYQRLHLAFERNEADAALALGKRLEEAYPRSRWLGPMLWMRGETLLGSSRYDEAVKAYTQLANLGAAEFLLGQGSQVRFKIGMAYYYGGNYQEAAHVLAEVADGPLLPDALFWQAEAHYRLGGYDTARALYQRLIATSPSFERLGEAYYGLGWAASRQGDHASARDAYQEALRSLSDPQAKLDAQFRLGTALLSLHEWEASRAAFAGLANQNESGLGAEAHYQIAWSYYRQGRLAEAATSFGQFASQHNQDRLAPSAWLGQGRAFFRLNRFAEAIGALKTAVSHPLATPGQVVEAREQLAAAYQNNGQHEEARQTYETLAQVANLPAERAEEYRQGLLSALMKASNFRGARAELLKRPAMSEGDRALMQSIAEAFFGQRQWDEVLETYRLTPQPQAQQALWAGHAYLEKRAYADAVKVLEPLRDQADSELKAIALFDLAKSYRGKQDLGRAKETYLSLADNYPKRANAVDALLEAGDAAKEQRDYTGAQAIFRRVAENRELSGDRRRQAWMALGDMQRGIKQWGPALLAYRSARAIGPSGHLETALAGYWSASALVEMKQFKEALRELESIRYPENAEPLPSLAQLKQGEALERLGRWKQAFDLYAALSSTGSPAEREEARTRYEWIKKNVPEDMRR